MSNCFIIFISLFLFGCSKSDEGKGIFFKLGEALIGIDGFSYTRIAEENKELVTKEYKNKCPEVRKFYEENERRCAQHLGEYKEEKFKAIKELEARLSIMEKKIWGGEVPKLYTNYGSSKPGIYIDSCTDADGKPSETYKRPEKLYLLHDQGSIPLEYQKDEETIYEDGEKTYKKNLWVFKASVSVNSTSPYEVIISSNNLSYKSIKQSDLIEVKQSEVSNVKAPALPSTCKKWRFKSIFYTECSDGVAELSSDQRILLTSDTDGYGTSEIKLLGEVNVNGFTYYHVYYATKGSSNYSLVSEIVENLYPIRCD